MKKPNYQGNHDNHHSPEQEGTPEDAKRCVSLLSISGKEVDLCFQFGTNLFSDWNICLGKLININK